jgi:hypothetical protein
MPHLKTWNDLPAGVRQHLIDRMRDRNISLDDLNRLRIWVESNSIVPEGEWYKDFGSLKIFGQGPLPNTFLLSGQPAKGERI